jgi:hypothetical protein
MTKTVWRVHAFRLNDVDVDDDDYYLDEDGTVYSQYFTTREAAHEIYARGEKEIGIVHGIHWHLKMYALDADHAMGELEELIQKTKERD